MPTPIKDIEVAAGILWRQGLFLAAQRPKGKTWAGFWEFPGGKRERGESIEETLRRELREELGITCGPLLAWKQISHSYPDIRVRLHFIHVRSFTGEPEPCDGQALRWLSPAEALTLTFLPADKDIVTELRAPF